MVDNNLAAAISNKDQVFASVRDNLDIVIAYSKGHPDSLVRCLATIVLSEYALYSEEQINSESRDGNQ